MPSIDRRRHYRLLPIADATSPRLRLLRHARHCRLPLMLPFAVMPIHAAVADLPLPRYVAATQPCYNMP